MYYFIYILYSLTLVSSLPPEDDNTNSNTNLGASAISLEEISDFRRRNQHKYEDSLESEHGGSEEEWSSLSRNGEDTTERHVIDRTTRRNHKKKHKHSTPYTTKYERGTIKKHKTHAKDHKSNPHRKEFAVNKDVYEKKNILRTDEYVYTYVNITIDEKGQKVPKVIIYNKTHYLIYTGSEIPTTYPSLYGLWSRLHEKPKQFDDEFTPPWWMEWHKPPWWMDWHTPPPSLSNDTWDIWNSPGMQPPPPYIDDANKKNSGLDLSKWLRQLWDHVNVDNIRVSSWKKINGINKTKDTNLARVFNHPHVVKGNYVPFDLMTRLKQLWGNVKDDKSVNSRSSRFQDILNKNEELPKIESESIPIKIKDDKEINDFTKRILNSTLRLCDKVRSKSNEYHWRKAIKRLSKLYEDKYRKFLKDTRDQKIKSELGNQKVILNAIDVSDRIAIRLLDFMLESMDKQGVLRIGQTGETFRKELKNEKRRQLKNACVELKVCRAGSGLIPLILEVMRLMLSSDDQKLRQAYDSVTESAKNTDFTNTFSAKGDQALKKMIGKFETENTFVVRTALLIIRNIIDRRNTPITVPPGVDPSNSIVKKTLALQEILNKVDEKVPNTQVNVATWTGIHTDMAKWTREGSPNIQDIMKRLVATVKYSIESLDSTSRQIILQNVNKILS